MRNKLTLIGGMYLSLVICAGILFYFFGKENFQEMIGKIQEMGFGGVFIFILVYIILAMLFFPMTLLSFSSGVIYGFGWGFFATIISANLAALLTFILVRYYLRGWLEKRINKSKQVKVLDEAVAKEGWKIIALSRVSIVAPFSLLNCIFGLTKISLPMYAGTTFLAMLPGAVFYVYLGTAAGNIMAYFEKGKNPNPLEWGMTAAVIAASVTLIGLLAFLAKRSLQKELPLVSD